MIGPTLAGHHEIVGRGDRIRTCDPLLPKQMRYQAALLPGPVRALGGFTIGGKGNAGERAPQKQKPRRNLTVRRGHGGRGKD